MQNKRIRIGVNTRILLKNKLEGVGRFTYETLKIISNQNPEIDFYFFFDRKFDDSFVFSDNVKPIVVYPQARHPFLFYLWFEWAIPYQIKKHKIDCFLSQDGFTSLSLKIPNLIVMHDLAFEHFPNAKGYLIQKYWKTYSPKFAKSADRIATVSNFTKNDIVSKYKIEAGKIDVVYNGANSSCKALDNNEKEAVKKEFTKGEDYFLFVSAIHPRKNLARILLAFDTFKKESNAKTKLLIVGRMAWNNKELKRELEGLSFKNDLIFTGHLPIEKVEKIYGAALSLCYISLFEGFGIPIVEAFNAECPVITSNVSSMPEVAGDAALLINPFKIGEIKTAMLKMYENENLRLELIEKGRLQKMKFNWQKSADLLWQSFQKIM